jgi:hemerythrin
MDHFIWGKEYKTGVPELDCEHVILFALYNQLCSIMEREAEEDALSDVMNALATYIKIHFLHEEGLLEKAGYPDLEAHRDEHRQFIAEIDRVYTEFTTTSAAAAARDLKTLVLTWLTAHILKVDKAYSPLLAPGFAA